MFSMNHEQQILKIAKRKGIIRSRDLVDAGLSRTALQRLTEQEKLLRLSRGLYVLADADISEHFSLAEVSKRFPAGVVCLLTALRFHDLTTESPHRIWLAYERGKHRPQCSDLPLKVVSFSGKSFSYGIEHHTVDGVEVAVTSPAKTVADCFKFRKKIGLEIAVEALKDFRQKRAGTLDELLKASKVCRVSKVIRPYLEVLS